jgi:hypothetical protein
VTTWGNAQATRELTAHGHFRRATALGSVTGGPDTEMPWDQLLDGGVDADGSPRDPANTTRAYARAAGLYVATYCMLGNGQPIRAYLRHMTAAGAHKRYGGQHAADDTGNIHVSGASVFDMLAGEYVMLIFYLAGTTTVDGVGAASNPVGAYLTLARLD